MQTNYPERGASTFTDACSTLLMVIFRPGPSWLQGKTLFEQPLERHAEYMQKLFEQGKLLNAGPFLDNCGGLAILRVTNESEAREIIGADPATSEKLFVAELHPWYLSFDANKGRSSVGTQLLR